jgi:Ca2+-binding RTX toxin-like protein
MLDESQQTLVRYGTKIVTDTIDVAGTTDIDGTAGNDYIRLTHTDKTVDAAGRQFAITGGADRIDNTTGLTINGELRTGGQFSVEIAATINAGDGNDTVHAGDLGNNVFGGLGDDTIYGGRLDDFLIGGDGNDSLNAGADDASALGGDGNYLDGGEGNDLLVGREGSDWLEGGAGTDILEGGRGDDILAGGGGAGDILRGGLGDDHYIFRIGDTDGSGDLLAADIIRDESGLTVQSAIAQSATGTPANLSTTAGRAQFRKLGLGKWMGSSGDTVTTQVSLSSGDQVQAGGNDTLVLGVGITLDDISIIKADNNSDLIIRITGTGEHIILQDWFNPFNKIENLAFADGQVLRIADFDTFTLGTDGADYIYGTNGNDFAHGGNGNDIITLLFGDDFGNGGGGNDYVSGDGGNDIVIGLDGDDIVLGGADVDNVTGGSGNDEVRGGSGNDVVSGGSGNDFVSGGTGNDIYKFARGDGQDTFVDQLSNEWEVIWRSGEGFIAAAGYSVGAQGSAEAGQIFHTVQGVRTRIFDGSVWSMTTSAGVEPVRIEFDATTGELLRHRPASSAAIANKIVSPDVQGNNNDVIEFSIGIDVSDLQFAVSGNDLLVGIEPSSGSVSGFATISDRIILKEWQTLPTINPAVRSSIENFSFFSSGTINVSALDIKAGTDGVDTALNGTANKGNWITGGAGDDIITGAGLNDILNGNSGDDTLIGGNGVDILFGGAGNDILEGQNGGDYFEGTGTDSLGNNLGTGAVAVPGGRGDTLIGGDGFDLASYASAANGVTINLGNAASNSRLTAAGDTYFGIEGLIGSRFDDIITGDDSDNELTGNGVTTGSDQLFGLGGNDTYVFGRNDGLVVVTDQFQGTPETIVDASGRVVEPYVERFDLISGEPGAYDYAHRIEHIGTGEIVYEKAITSTTRLNAPPARSADGWIDGLLYQGNAISRPAVDATINAGDDAVLIGVSARLASTSSSTAAVGWSELSFYFGTTVGQTDDLFIKIGASNSIIQLKKFKTSAGVFNTVGGIESLLLSDGEQAALKGLVFNANGTLGTVGNADDNLIVDNAGRAMTLTGGSGNDVLSGRDGIDRLEGGDGDDILSGGDGGDVLDAGAGIDTITYYGAAAAVATTSTPPAGTGVNVNLTPSNISGSGTATSTGKSESTGDTYIGIENVIGSDFNDTITGDQFDNVLRGNAGNDMLFGNDGNDVLVGGDGNDTVTGGLGDDAIEGGEGDDSLTGLGDNDIITGGAGNDTLVGDATNAVNGGSQEVSTYNRIVNGSFETLGATAASLPGWASLSGQPFPVIGASGSRRLALDGGTSNIEISQVIDGIGAGQNLTLSFDARNTTGSTGPNFEVYWNGVKLAPQLIANSTTIYSINITGSQTGGNILKFTGTGAADGNGATIDDIKLVTRGGGADTLIGGDGTDTIYGNDGNDTLSGGAGSVDKLYGGDGDDRLDGGQGTDYLEGGSGNDIYTVFGDGGSDFITVGGGHDSIVYGATVEGGNRAITVDQVRLTRSGDNLVISIAGTSSVVSVSRWFNTAPATTPSASAARRIIVGDTAIAQSDVEALFKEQARIGPGAPDAAYEAVLARVWQPLATYSDRFTFTGTVNADAPIIDPAIIGGVTFNGLGANDRLNGTASNDVFDGGTGDDTVNAGAGDDTLNSGADNDQLNGQDGNDTIVFGTDIGFDRVDGGAGNDQIIVATDNAIIGLSGLANVEVIDGTARANAQIRLGTASILDLSAVTVSGIARIVGSAGADTVTGSAGNDVIDGGVGNDRLIGGGGDDILNAGPGDDYLDGGVGRDIVDFTGLTSTVTVDLAAQTVGHAAAGSKTIISGIEGVFGGSGADTLRGSANADRIVGGSGNDQITGGDGDDDLAGGFGNDIVNAGTGDDYIHLLTVDDATDRDIIDGGSGTDTVSFAARTTNLFVDVRHQHENLGFRSIENVIGGSAHDTIIGTGDDNYLSGGAGDDHLVGEGGNDALEGGIGNDIIDGGSGTNTIVYRGKIADYTISNGRVVDNNTVDGDDGTDIFTNINFIQFADFRSDVGIDPNNKPTLVLSLADQIFADNSSFSYVVPESTFDDQDEGDVLQLTATLPNGDPLPGWLTFNPSTRTFIYNPAVQPVSAGTGITVKVTASDGSADVSDEFVITVVEGRGAAIVGTDGNDTINGTFRGEAINGGAGNDVIGGAGGDDVIDGGSGADLLVGDAGSDILIGGDGDDALNGAEGADVLRGGTGSDFAYYYYISSGVAASIGVSADLQFVNNNSGVAVGDSYDSIENLYGTISGDTLSGNELTNIIYGEQGDDVIDGRDGNDFLYANQGDDIVRGGRVMTPSLAVKVTTI